MNVVLPAPSSPLSTSRSPACSCAASDAPSCRIDSASGTLKRNVRSGRPAPRWATRGGPRGSPAAPRTARSPAAPRAPRPQLVEALRRVDRVADSRAAMPWPRVGDDPEPAEVHRAAHRVEQQRPDRLAVEAGQQPAVRRAARPRRHGLGPARRPAGRAAGARTPPDHRQHLGRGLRADPSYADRHRLVDPLGGRGDQLVERRVDLLVPLHDHHVAGALALDQRRALDVLVQLAAVADRGELVVGAADDRGGHLAERLDHVELVERRRTSGRTPRPPRTASPRASRRRTRRSSPARRRRTRTRRSPP